MVKQSFLLDPEAEPNVGEEYTTTEKTKLTSIAEGAEVNPADLDAVPDSATRQAMVDTEKTKLAGIEPFAEVNVGEIYTTGEAVKLAGVEDNAAADQTGAEVRDLIVGLGDVERKIVITEPVTGEFPIISVHRQADGKTKVSYDDVPVA